MRLKDFACLEFVGLAWLKRVSDGLSGFGLVWDVWLWDCWFGLLRVGFGWVGWSLASHLCCSVIFLAFQNGDVPGDVDDGCEPARAQVEDVCQVEKDVFAKVNSCLPRGFFTNSLQVGWLNQLNPLKKTCLRSPF